MLLLKIEFQGKFWAGLYQKKTKSNETIQRRKIDTGIVRIRIPVDIRC